MTLILSTITPDYVLLVCDRRLTYEVPDPSAAGGISYQVSNEDATKAVLFHHHSVFGYTGLAQLPRSRRFIAEKGDNRPDVLIDTNLWLAEVLSLGKCLRESLDAVREEAAIAIARRTTVPLKYRRQAFIGVGWTQDPPGTPLVPMIHEINNYENHREFVRTKLPLEGELWRSHPSLDDLPSRPFKMCDRHLSRAFRRGLGPATVARILTETVRDVARQKTTVGRGILQLCIPRDQVEKVERGESWSFSAEPINLDRLTFRYLPAGSDDGFQHGPTHLSRHGPIMREIWMAPNNSMTTE